MTIKGSWSRVKDHDKFGAEHDRIFKRTAESEADHKRRVKIDQLTKECLEKMADTWSNYIINGYSADLPENVKRLLDDSQRQLGQEGMVTFLVDSKAEESIKIIGGQELYGTEERFPTYNNPPTVDAKQHQLDMIDAFHNHQFKKPCEPTAD